MSLELKITAEIVDAEDGGTATVSLTDGHAAAAISQFGKNAYNDASASDVAAGIAEALASTAAGGPTHVMKMRPGSRQWNLAREMLELSEEAAQAMGTVKLADDFSAMVGTSRWRDFLKGRAAQRYDGGGLITLTEDSTRITGEGTTFQSASGRVLPGKHVLQIQGQRYGISEVTSETELVLEAPYDEMGERLSPRHYSIEPA